jgi:hypothetical protein
MTQASPVDWDAMPHNASAALQAEVSRASQQRRRVDGAQRAAPHPVAVARAAAAAQPAAPSSRQGRAAAAAPGWLPAGGRRAAH